MRENLLRNGFAAVREDRGSIGAAAGTCGRGDGPGESSESGGNAAGEHIEDVNAGAGAGAGPQSDRPLRAPEKAAGEASKIRCRCLPWEVRVPSPDPLHLTPLSLTNTWISKKGHCGAYSVYVAPSSARASRRR